MGREARRTLPIRRHYGHQGQRSCAERIELAGSNTALGSHSSGVADAHRKLQQATLTRIPYSA